MPRALAVALIVLVLAASFLGMYTLYSSQQETAAETFDPLKQEIYISSTERLLYVPWQSSLKSYDLFFVSYTAINAQHTEVTLVINGTEKTATLGKKLDFTDTAGVKYIAIVEDISCQFVRMRIMEVEA